MKRTILAATIALAFSATASANPTNNATGARADGLIGQVAVATNEQSGDGPKANEYSQAIQDNSTETLTLTGTDSSTSTETNTNTETINRGQPWRHRDGHLHQFV
ncbi:hypothetical protein [Massilia sp. TWR1-2-2]|uniref:hypothetical protein n=1 Tax=Massilia sp. TWR1-2-2 TaxID=2804584 RepID=UPI003CE98DC7